MIMTYPSRSNLNKIWNDIKPIIINAADNHIEQKKVSGKSSKPPKIVKSIQDIKKINSILPGHLKRIN